MYVLTIALPPNFVPIKSLHLHGDPISLATTGWLDGWMAGWRGGNPPDYKTNKLRGNLTPWQLNSMNLTHDPRTLFTAYLQLSTSGYYKTALVSIAYTPHLKSVLFFLHGNLVKSYYSFFSVFFDFSLLLHADSG